jgi:hypothetical protein
MPAVIPFAAGELPAGALFRQAAELTAQNRLNRFI